MLGDFCGVRGVGTGKGGIWSGKRMWADSDHREEDCRDQRTLRWRESSKELVEVALARMGKMSL